MTAFHIERLCFGIHHHHKTIGVASKMFSYGNACIISGDDSHAFYQVVKYNLRFIYKVHAQSPGNLGIHTYFHHVRGMNSTLSDRLVYKVQG